MTVHVSAASRCAALDVMFNTLNGGTLELRAGPPEASPEADPSGTLLLATPLATPAFASATGVPGQPALKTWSPIASGTAIASGLAEHVRALDASGQCVLVGTLPYGGLHVTAGEPVVAGVGGQLSMAA